MERTRFECVTSATAEVTHAAEDTSETDHESEG